VGIVDLRHSRGESPGSPLVSIAREVAPSSMTLLWADTERAPIDGKEAFESWLRSEFPECEVGFACFPCDDGSLIMDFEWVHEHARKVLSGRDPDKQTFINASSGTPIMTAAWIVESKLIPDSKITLFQSSVEAGAKPLNLPPGLNISLAELISAGKGDKLLEAYASGQLALTPEMLGLRAKSEEMNKLAIMADLAAPTKFPILLTGERGTGKSRIAKFIHRAGKVSGEFVTVDCGSLTNESSLHGVFGWKRGSFTGAEKENPGLVEEARHGTLFLDEVGNAPPLVQQSLLRLLQEKKYRPLGGNQDCESDARIIAATNENLQDAVQEGRFRADLLDRIAIIELGVPPLRERGEDIKDLAAELLKDLQESNTALFEESNRKKKVFSEEALNCLSQHDWPGNVRELEGLVIRLLVFLLPESTTIASEDVAKELRKRDNPLSLPPIKEGFRLNVLIEEIKTKYAEDALRLTEGNKSKAASLLGFENRTPLNTILGQRN
jgi:DNA-binding NtrC family response regulator